MNTTLWIILGVSVAFIGIIVLNYRKMKKMEAVPPSKNIKTLTKKNFSAHVKSGVVLIDFWAAWCGPCKMIAPILNDLAESEKDVTIAKVNVEHEQALANKFKVRNIPTIILMKDGKEVKRMVGMKTKKTLIKEIRAVS